MPNLKTEPGEVHMTIQIKRAATGKVDEVKLVGKVIKPEVSTSGEVENS